jgi:hypothetical protein
VTHGRPPPLPCPRVPPAAGLRRLHAVRRATAVSAARAGDQPLAHLQPGGDSHPQQAPRAGPRAPPRVADPPHGDPLCPGPEQVPPGRPALRQGRPPRLPGGAALGRRARGKGADPPGAGRRARRGQLPPGGPPGGALPRPAVDPARQPGLSGPVLQPRVAPAPAGGSCRAGRARAATDRGCRRPGRDEPRLRPDEDREVGVLRPGRRLLVLALPVGDGRRAAGARGRAPGGADRPARGRAGAGLLPRSDPAAPGAPSAQPVQRLRGADAAVRQRQAGDDGQRAVGHPGAAGSAGLQEPPGSTGRRSLPGRPLGAPRRAAERPRLGGLEMRPPAGRRLGPGREPQRSRGPGHLRRGEQPAARPDGGLRRPAGQVEPLRLRLSRGPGPRAVAPPAPGHRAHLRRLQPRGAGSAPR